jgi:two-component system phosphate regulon sensor histidine kinase PhoR
MATNTPRNVAIRTALLISAAVVVLLSLCAIFLPSTIHWGVIPVAGLVTFVGGYMIVAWAVERFIYQKVKIIYKAIHRLKRTGPRPDITMNEDVLDEVKKDVLDWADDRVSEIRSLREQDSFRRDYIGNLSHELKTPVFNIQGYILTLLEGALEDPRHNRIFLEKAARSVDRMVVLLEDLDGITRIESGNLELYREDFDLNKLAREVIESLEHTAKKSNIKLGINSSKDGVIPINADRSRVEQILTNLVVNSIKYGKEGGTTKVRFYDMDTDFLVEVADDGIGMTAEHLPRVFERFYRVDKSRSRHHGGTGLGLAIVKHLVEAHGQTINVRSTEGVGSTFSFTMQKTK